MKHLFFSLFTIVLLSCGGNNANEITPDIINNPITGAENKEEEKLPIVTFSEDRFEFGKVSQGELVQHVFEITNTGNAPLVISSIYGECSCTVADNFTKDPIQPGEKTTFTASFDTEKKEGKQNIRVYVIANTHPTKNITVLAGEVLKPQ